MKKRYGFLARHIQLEGTRSRDTPLGERPAEKVEPASTARTRREFSLFEKRGKLTRRAILSEDRVKLTTLKLLSIY